MRLSALPAEVAVFVGVILYAPHLAASDKHTVVVLVDESGTLKKDPGWRKRAASLLAYSLTSGSSLAISGFGNPGRSLPLKPLPIGDTGQELSNRKILSDCAFQLGDSDSRTDIYGAIRSALKEFASIPPRVRESSPPVMIILSDFVSDPVPTAADRETLCGDLRSQKGNLPSPRLAGLHHNESFGQFRFSGAQTRPYQ
jgi:hypothetical protein